MRQLCRGDWAKDWCLPSLSCRVHSNNGDSKEGWEVHRCEETSCARETTPTWMSTLRKLSRCSSRTILLIQPSCQTTRAVQLAQTRNGCQRRTYFQMEVQLMSISRLVPRAQTQVVNIKAQATISSISLARRQEQLALEADQTTCSWQPRLQLWVVVHREPIDLLVEQGAWCLHTAQEHSQRSRPSPTILISTSAQQTQALAQKRYLKMHQALPCTIDNHQSIKHMKNPRLDWKQHWWKIRKGYHRSKTRTIRPSSFN